MIGVLDWETTGLALHPQAANAMQPRAIEFGACLLGPRGQIVEEYSIIINPQAKIEPVITKITGLVQADLDAAPTLREVFPRIQGFFKQCHAIVTHNLPFDKQVAQAEAERLGIPWDDWHWPARELCTVQEYREEFGKNPKLEALYERVMGKPANQTHRALDDVKLIVEIIQEEKLWRYLS